MKLETDGKLITAPIRIRVVRGVSVVRGARKLVTAQRVRVVRGVRVVKGARKLFSFPLITLNCP